MEFPDLNKQTYYPQVRDPYFRGCSFRGGRVPSDPNARSERWSDLFQGCSQDTLTSAEDGSLETKNDSSPSCRHLFDHCDEGGSADL